MAGEECAQCGRRFRRDELVCPSCGTTRPMMGSGRGAVMTTCADCGKSISARATACPHCGAPTGKQQTVYAKPDWGIDWKSETHIGSWPLVHVAIGRRNGKLCVAKGVIAVGQFGFGVITIAQFGVGLLFGFGQFLFAPIAVAQFAAAILFGLGQFSCGYVAIGQIAVGTYVLAQVGYGTYEWTSAGRDPVAVEFFRNLAGMIGIGQGK